MISLRKLALTAFSAGLLLGPDLATAQTVDGGPLSSRYTVKLGDRQVPILQGYEKAARNLDRNHDRVLTREEFGASAKELPGGLRVDLDDYSLGMAHEFTGTPSSFVTGYPSAAEIEGALDQLRDAYPDRVTLIPLGPTGEGRKIVAVRVALADGLERPKIAVIAQQHAREWMAHQVALASLRALLENPANADLMQAFEFWFVPLANPDGYEYSRLVDPMWRKNRGAISDSSSKGVDLNRNFPADFRRDGDSLESVEDDWGASDRPYSALYRGARSGSEPETRDLQTLLDLPGMIGVVDVHGFGCKVVLPNQKTRVEDERYQSLAQSMVEALGPDYEVLRYKDLYPITGHLAAYADQQGVVGITLEVGKAFQPNPAKIKEVARVGTLGVMAFARTMMGLLGAGQ